LNKKRKYQTKSDEIRKKIQLVVLGGVEEAEVSDPCRKWLVVAAELELDLILSARELVDCQAWV